MSRMHRSRKNKPNGVRIVGSRLDQQGRSYFGREQWLRRIGFDSYRQYLDSDLWKRVRDKVFNAYGSNCLCCGNRATQVHHQRYRDSDLTGKRINYLVPICNDCHVAVEYDAGAKVGVDCAARRCRERIWARNELLGQSKRLSTRRR